MTEYSVTELCAILRVSRAGFYQWKKCRTSQRERNNNNLLSRIKAIFNEYKGIYGSPRIHAELRDQSIYCNRLLEQNFVVDAPNKVWTADITITNQNTKYKILKQI